MTALVAVIHELLLVLKKANATQRKPQPLAKRDCAPELMRGPQ